MPTSVISVLRCFLIDVMSEGIPRTGQDRKATLYYGCSLSSQVHFTTVRGMLNQEGDDSIGSAFHLKLSSDGLG